MPENLVYIGTYTERTPNASKGIYAARFDPATGKLSTPTLVAELENPSFVAVSRPSSGEMIRFPTCGSMTC